MHTVSRLGTSSTATMAFVCDLVAPLGSANNSALRASTKGGRSRHAVQHTRHLGPQSRPSSTARPSLLVAFQPSDRARNNTSAARRSLVVQNSTRGVFG